VVQANAYWTIDYAVYDSDESLRKLLDVLHDGAELETGGWTNLSSMPLEPHISVMPYDPHGRMRTFIRIPKDHPRDQVTMLVMLGPEASAEFAQAPDQGGPRHVILTGPPPDSGASKIVRQAMADGVVEGVLAPERLLAVTRLVPTMNPATPVPATPEDAARLAKAAYARWTTIYTLRKSPLDRAGIKLIHTGMESMYGPPNLPSNPGNMVGSLQSNRFNLSPEDRAAHQRAVEALKKNQ
jgi:hypothetical protein